MAPSRPGDEITRVSALSDLPSADDAAAHPAHVAPPPAGDADVPVVVIEPPRGWGSLGLGELWAHR